MNHAAILQVMAIPELWHKIQTYALLSEIREPEKLALSRRLRKDYKDHYRHHQKAYFTEIHWGRWYLRALRPTFRLLHEIEKDHKSPPNIGGLRFIPVEEFDPADGSLGYFHRAYVKRGYGYYNPKKYELIHLASENMGLPAYRIKRLTKADLMYLFTRFSCDA